jgi:c-di-GMP-binding flagellar brake protein YcgR
MEDDSMLHAQDPAPDARPDGPWGAERRAAPRIDWPVTAQLLQQVSVTRSERHGGEARTVNISLSGVLVAVPFECTPGELLAMRFPLDRGDELSVVARVVRIDAHSHPDKNEWLAGCEFTEISVKDRCTLAKFLMRRRADVIDAHARRTGLR